MGGFGTGFANIILMCNRLRHSLQCHRRRKGENNGGGRSASIHGPGWGTPDERCAGPGSRSSKTDATGSPRLTAKGVAGSAEHCAVARDPPGIAGFAPQASPPDSAPVFLHNVSKPDLHVFRPTRPSGHALLVIPGGAYRFVSVVNKGVDVAARLNPAGITVFVLTYRLPGEGWLSHARCTSPGRATGHTHYPLAGFGIRDQCGQSECAGIFRRRPSRCHPRHPA